MYVISTHPGSSATIMWLGLCGVAIKRSRMRALSNLYRLSNGRHILQGECCAWTSRIQGCWTLLVGEILDARRKDVNSHDRQLRSWTPTLSVFEHFQQHLPREYSRIPWHFLQRGGKISCEITGRRQCGLGLVVPCVYKFQEREACCKAART